MNLSRLPKITTSKKKRLGRGYSSGKGGHTSSRGQKGQNSRNSVPIWFEGGQLPLIRRTPFIKGKSRLKSLRPDPIIIKTSQLAQFKAKSTVSLDSAIKTLKLSPKTARTSGIKILFDQPVNTSLKVLLPASKKAADSIKKAGGEIKSA